MRKEHIVETSQEKHIFNERDILFSIDTKWVVKLYRTFRDRRFARIILFDFIFFQALFTCWSSLVLAENFGLFCEIRGRFQKNGRAFTLPAASKALVSCLSTNQIMFIIF